MNLSTMRSLKAVSYLVIITLCASLTFVSPSSVIAKQKSKAKKSASRNVKSAKSSRASRQKSRPSRSRGKVAKSSKGATKGHYARVKVRGRNGKTVWKKVYVARRTPPRPASTGSAYSGGVHKYLTESWVNAQMNPSKESFVNAPPISPSSGSLPGATPGDAANMTDERALSPAVARQNNGILIPSQPTLLDEDGLPINPLVAAYSTSLVSRGFSPDNQGLIVTTLNGEVLAEHNADRLFNPASVTKVATTLTAMARLGPNFQFSTKLLTDGYLDPTTGTLKGSLYLIGSGDPAFFYENALLVADQLNRNGIYTVEGNFIVLGQFYYNFIASRESSAKAIRNTWNPATWNATARLAYSRFQAMRPLEQQRSGVTGQYPSLKILGDTIANPDGVNTSTLKPLAVHTSLPLIRILKALNDFSNNWMSAMVGNLVGGPDAVQKFLEREVGFKNEEIDIVTSSGLGSNQISPRGTVKMMRKLVSYLQKYNLKLEDMLPIAGIDEGTLKRRFTDAYRGSVVGKTGTLSSVSALAGIAYTRGKGPLLFVIYNRGGSSASFRNVQDETLKKIITLYGGPAPVHLNNMSSPRVSERMTENGKSPALVVDKQ